MRSYLLREHTLIHSPMAGNGYHGNCAHCGIACETDLGLDTFSEFECVEREPTNPYDMPKEVREYARFHGFVWNVKTNLWVKPYQDIEFTLKEMYDRVNELLKKNYDNDKTIV